VWNSPDYSNATEIAQSGDRRRETVSAQTVSKVTRDLDETLREFHQARWTDDYVYLFLDGVSLRVWRPTGRKPVQMLVAYGIRRDGSRGIC
jgi:transposase-like protein